MKEKDNSRVQSSEFRDQNSGPGPENTKRLKSLRDRMATVKPTRWVRFGIVSLIFFLFVIWVGNPWLLLVWFLLADIYITQYIPWGWWKNKKGVTRTVMGWVDAIVYALILVYFIFAFVGQNYKIPSSSLEKSLLIGDYLWVNKAIYGPRVPNTPLHFPLADHTMPLIGGKSYIDNPQLTYHRLPGMRWVERGDIVVFNYPEGDTTFSMPVDISYYEYDYLTRKNSGLDGKSAYNGQWGDIIVRPIDRIDAYVKRAVGLPGDRFQLRGDTIFINGNPLGLPEHVQFSYIVNVSGPISPDKWLELGVSKADYEHSYYVNEDGSQSFYIVPLTREKKAAIEALPEVEGPVLTIREVYGAQVPETLWPRGDAIEWGWTIGDTDEFWIPQKGKTLHVTLDNLPLYRRAIETYEGNSLQVTPEGRILINGVDNPYYTFKYDYFWMMGDNRDNSKDSRFFGLVPETHIIGMPMRILISLDEERGLFDGKIRWGRTLSNPNPDKATIFSE